VPQLLVRAELGLVRPSHLNLNYLNQFPVKNHPMALAFPDRLQVRAENEVPIFSEAVTKTLVPQVQAVAEQLQVQGLAEQPVAVLAQVVEQPLLVVLRANFQCPDAYRSVKALQNHLQK